jgi:Uma2 family endonuclease
MSRLSSIKMTAKQFLLLGEDPPGVRLELAHGEIVVSPSPTPDHAYTVLALGAVLKRHIDENDLGVILSDVDTEFGEHDVRRPDLFFFVKSRLRYIGEKSIEGPPDLAIEVISPSNKKMDRQDKFNLYAASGVKHYWIVDPRQRTIEAYRLSAGKYVGRVRGSGSDTIQLPPFRKLRIELAKLWRPK